MPSKPEASQAKPIRLTAVAYQEDATKNWIVQTIEHDIAASGKDLAEALDRLDYLITGFVALAHEHGTALFAGIKPAPTKFHDMFSRAKASGSIVPTTRKLLPIFKARAKEDALSEVLQLGVCPPTAKAA